MTVLRAFRGINCDNFHTVSCSWFTKFHQQQGNSSSGFSSNSEADASELLENPEEMFPLYYMRSDIYSVSLFQPQNSVLPVVNVNITNTMHYLIYD